MVPEYIIIDASVKFIGARNLLEESLFYRGEDNWCKNFDKAKKYTEANEAITHAKILNQDLPVKVLLVQNEGNRIGVGEIKF